MTLIDVILYSPPDFVMPTVKVPGCGPAPTPVVTPTHVPVSPPVLATVFTADGVVARALGVALPCEATGEEGDVDGCDGVLPALMRVTAPVITILFAESTPRVAGYVSAYPQVFVYQDFSVPW
ncbi:MAG TPA: hypothetical protein VME19_19965 [Streptosporangiaceae bacterium]|nr:hypothetical protein [Streptosporangiaceae bacterium]